MIPDPNYDIRAAGGLRVVLERELAAVGRPLRAAPPASIPFADCRFEAGRRFVQCFLAPHERLIKLEFWGRGFALARSQHPGASEVARVILYWLVDEVPVHRMLELVPEFQPLDGAAEIDAGRAAEVRWQNLLSHTYPPTMPLVQAAALQPKLRQLFPYTSLWSLCFSRTTGFPYTRDCPWAEPMGQPWNEGLRKDQFVAHAPDGRVLGSGTAQEVIEILVQHLPTGCGPAVDGTAETAHLVTSGEPA